MNEHTTPIVGKIEQLTTNAPRSISEPILTLHADDDTLKELSRLQQEIESLTSDRNKLLEQIKMVKDHYARSEQGLGEKFLWSFVDEAVAEIEGEQ